MNHTHEQIELPIAKRLVERALAKGYFSLVQHRSFP